MALLVLVRHGESLWNNLNLFTGWVDVPLTEKGLKQALQAGKALENVKFHACFTSELFRGIETAMLVLLKNKVSGVPVIVHEKGKMKAWSRIYGKVKFIPVIKAWQLNERYYGRLQGFNKAVMAEKVGFEKVHLWRRSFDVNPPGGEALKDTFKRVIPYFNKNIKPLLDKGKNVLIAAHGNSLRALVMYLENISKQDVLNLEIPLGKPLIYKTKVKTRRDKNLKPGEMFQRVKPKQSLLKKK